MGMVVKVRDGLFGLQRSSPQTATYLKKSDKKIKEKKNKNLKKKNNNKKNKKDKKKNKKNKSKSDGHHLA